jgi:hypothetical protein
MRLLGKLLVAIAGAAAMLTSPAFANEECWAASGLNGYSAFSDSSYRFETDRLTSVIVLCLTPTGGTVTGTYLPFSRVGPSTLVGVRNDEVEVYQIDRERQKMLYVRSKVGQKATFPMLQDAVGSFVGDAKRVK